MEEPDAVPAASLYDTWELRNTLMSDGYGQDVVGWSPFLWQFYMDVTHMQHMGYCRECGCVLLDGFGQGPLLAYGA